MPSVRVGVSDPAFVLGHAGFEPAEETERMLNWGREPQAGVPDVGTSTPIYNDSRDPSYVLGVKLPLEDAFELYHCLREYYPKKGVERGTPYVEAAAVIDGEGAPTGTARVWVRQRGGDAPSAQPFYKVLEEFAPGCLGQLVGPTIPVKPEGEPMRLVVIGDLPE